MPPWDCASTLQAWDAKLGCSHSGSHEAALL